MGMVSGEVRTSFNKDLAAIQAELLEMGKLATTALQEAIEALETHNEELAAKVIEADSKIDELQIVIEDKTVELIALQQPIAKDLRVLSAALKMTTDLERIGDHAKKIAKVALNIGQKPHFKPLVDIPHAAGLARKMVLDALEAYVTLDVQKAQEVLANDNEVDALCTTCKRDLLMYMIKDLENVPQGMELSKVVQRLERIGDHATNLAEWIIYLVTGHRYNNIKNGGVCK